METQPAASQTSDNELDAIARMPAIKRWAIGLRALRRLMQDPDDTAQALTMGVHLNAGVAGELLARFEQDPVGARLMREDASIDSRAVDLDALARLPSGTLGHEYARFLRERGLSPDIFQAPRNVGHAALTFIAKRMRQSHDIWHVLTGYATDVPGEVELQAFTYGQLHTPSSLLIAAGGALRGLREAHTLPRRARAAYARGRAARFLGTVAWEDHWATPVATLRAQLGLAPATLH